MAMPTRKPAVKPATRRPRNTAVMTADDVLRGWGADPNKHRPAPVAPKPRAAAAPKPANTTLNQRVRSQQASRRDGADILGGKK